MWDIVAIDGTVLNAPSDVRGEVITDDEGDVVAVKIHGSRTKTDEARVHHIVTDTSSKPHGAKSGLYNSSPPRRVSTPTPASS